MTPELLDDDVRERARPLSPEDRREAILDAVLPLLQVRGRDATSRELAEASGIAEGTLFRAFGDKESLFEAALERFFDTEPLRQRLRGIARDTPLEFRLAAILDVLRERYRASFAIITVFRLQKPPHNPHNVDEWLDDVIAILAPDQERLTVPLDTVAYYLRMVAFGSSIDHFNVARPFEARELAELITRGLIADRS